ncbi:uncharacterized protein JN550_002762 [Neoarthrinium moseri]|uniref:uncharacterized protein n=1 Tax=Neoarthrinium moseri TaxID=1658444 RepID=UPI001FDC6DBA|nr:uncharacterized protein JN550_002762 [Neoarthrinium moseri]KAI1874183.1 hypothetical protein JN550_002762 [Neoarthrinium moseri]
MEPSVHEAIYQWHEGVEDLEDYSPGGLHPVHLDETYHGGRYRIVHKLGFGSFSTVWLAWDTLRHKFAALKILRADVSQKNTESVILARLAAGQAEHPGRSYTTTLVDSFFIAGPNGRHQTIVTEAAGFSVAISKELSTTWMFPVQVARAIAAQLLLGLSYVHSCGVVHGDIHTNNVLFKHSCFSSQSVEELYQRVGEPQRLPVKRLDEQPPGPEVPRYCVPSASIVISAEDVTKADIIIADFGEAFLCETGSRTDVNLRTPLLLLPPEAIFHEGVNQAADVWTAACTLYEILGERPLFEGFMADEDLVVAEMISTIGRLPEHWWSSWGARRDYFLEDGCWDTNTTKMHEPRSRPLAERLRIMGRGDGTTSSEFTTQELAAIDDLLGSMLTYEPTRRITAKDALDNRWMTQYGLPAIEQLNATPPTA